MYFSSFKSRIIWSLSTYSREKCESVWLFIVTCKRYRWCSIGLDTCQIHVGQISLEIRRTVCWCDRSETPLGINRCLPTYYYSSRRDLPRRIRPRLKVCLQTFISGYRFKSPTLTIIVHVTNKIQRISLRDMIVKIMWISFAISINSYIIVQHLSVF